MPDSDLRPAAGAAYRPIPNVIRAHSRWWAPLMSKWGILGVVIFVGLVIGFADEHLGGLFSSGDKASPKRDRVAELNEFQEKAGKLNAAGVGEWLIAVLSDLPGDDPKTNFDRAHWLAYYYNDKWVTEDRVALRSDIEAKELKLKQQAAYQDLYGGIQREMQQTYPDNRKMIAVLKASLGKVSGPAIHEYGQRLDHYIEKQRETVNQMPALVREIGQLLTDWKSATPEAQREIRKKISVRLDAYAADSELRRRFPSYKPDVFAEKEKKAKDRLAAITGMSYEVAANVIAQSSGDAAPSDLNRAVLSLLERKA